MKKGLCCFVTPAKLKTQSSLKFAFEKKEIYLGRFEVSWRPWFELQIRFYINIQLFIFYKSPLREENVAEHKSRSLVLVRQWKLPNQRCGGQCIEHHPYFFMAVPRRCGINIASHEQEWWPQSLASSTSKKKTVSFVTSLLKLRGNETLLW